MTVAALQASISLRDAAAKRWDAVVIGAGPAGSVAAIVLARLGQRVLLVDRATFPRDKVCGCCLGPAAMATLDELGLTESLDAHGPAPLDRIDLRAGRRRLEAPMGGGRVISRFRFDAMLAEQAIRNGAAFLPHSVARIAAAGDMDRTVPLTVGEHRYEVRTKVVIAAGGLGFSIEGSSPSNHPRQRLWSRSRLGGATIVSDHSCDLPTGTVRMIVARRGYVGFARLEDDRLAVGGAFDASLVHDRGGLAGAAAQVLEESNMDVPEEFAAAHWLGAPQLTRRPSRVAAPRVLAVGDAAGFVEPFTGEGMTWAMQSARSAAILVGAFLQEPDAPWSSTIEHTWMCQHRSLVRASQWRCRLIAEALRHPMLLAGCMIVGRSLPRLSQAVVQFIHHPNAALTRAAALNPAKGNA